MFIIVIISLMFLGVGVGYLSRKRNIKSIQHLITVLIWVLLFLLGIEVGHNQAIINGLHTIGLRALFITFAGATGSIFASWGLWLYISKNKKEKE